MHETRSIGLFDPQHEHTPLAPIKPATFDHGLPAPAPRASKLPPPDGKHWLVRTVLSQRPWSLIASAGMALGFLSNGIVPVLVGHTIDEAIGPADLTRLVHWVSILVLMSLCSFGLMWIARYFAARSQLLIGHDLRMAVTARINDPRGFREHRTPGELLSISASDTQRVADGVIMTIFPVAELTAIIYTSWMMWTIHPALSIAVMVGGPLMVLIATWVAAPLQQRSGARQQALADAAATATDVVQGLRIVKGIGAVSLLGQRYRSISQQAYQKTIAATAAEAQLNGVTEAVGSIFVVALGIAAGVMTLHDALSIGELITVVGLTQFIITPMTMFGRNLASRWASAKASGRRVQAVLNADYAPEFLANDSDNALVSTRLDALSKLGRGIHVITEVDAALVEQLEQLGRRVGTQALLVAPHHQALFDGTVAENVHPDAQEAARAIKVAQAQDIPGGIERAVGEEGKQLSGGQRQRVGLARALAFAPSTLVLVNPTSAVDSVTEQRIVETVALERQQLCTIVFSASPAWHEVATTSHTATAFAEYITKVGEC